MFDDVIIGEGPSFNSTIKVCEVKGLDTLSENKYAYGVHDAYIGIRMTIYKNSKEGRDLAEFIKAGTDATVLQNWFGTLALTHANPLLLRQKIDAALASARFEGSELRAEEIRHALGIRR